MTAPTFKYFLAHALMATLLFSTIGVAQPTSPQEPAGNQAVDPQESLLPSVGPVKKEEAPLETIENFDFSKFEEFEFAQIMKRIKDNLSLIHI